MLNRKDIRVIKTSKNICDAFLELLKTMDFDDITVQHILDQAQINRTTFYKHYANKNALAKHLIDEFKQTVFLPALEKRFAYSSLKFSREVSPLLLQNREKVRSLWKIETPKIHLRQDMYQLIKQKYIENLHPQHADESINIEFQGHMYASFALAAMTFSVNSEQPLEPIQILANMKMLFEKAIL
ncbi:TetR/AcrR family transcriptional regulator [Necropsobacter massiliensis]|uniref:TetR/AcrR family transcriptional regulator n=1 Tax=Necropsobacter massiliensis TaxID=1400001 RepID=UPI000509E6C9|nr:TetR family transcriptional regulator [Necropsobacter massiliensis]